MTTFLRVQAVAGFHGTSRRVAETLIAGEPFRLSDNWYDWLGRGVYFWQDAPLLARRWARERFGEERTVVGAIIRMDACLDLLDIGWVEVLQADYLAFLARRTSIGRPLPKQTELLHGLDRAVIDRAVRSLELQGIRISSVRASFREGAPLYPGSALFDLAHVQIAVRDPSVIGEVWIEEPVAGVL